jgi:acylphosphatase
MFRLTAHVSGRVQRVGYRAKVAALAREMGLSGLIQNRPDGSVLVIAEGERDTLERFGSDLWIKNTLIDVLMVDSEITAGTGAFLDFRKITGPDEVGERLDDGIEILKSILGGIKNLDTGLKNLDTGLKNLTDITKAGFENLNRRTDKMLDKQDESIEEIRGLREDMKSHIDRRFDRIESRLAEAIEAKEQEGVT